MIADPFANWLPDVIADEVTIRTDAINDEALQNMWSFTLNQQQAARIAPTDIKDFLMAVISSRRNQLTERHAAAGQMRFYCWFDEQARQLRLSLVSACHRRPPFACQTVEAVDIDQIVRQFLDSVAEGTLLHDELRDAPVADGECLEEAPLRVWSTLLP
jgi:hypothetical protein